MTPENPVVGGTVLRIPAIQSPNFNESAGTGWAIFQNGNAFFFNITATGTITATEFIGTDFVITASGIFFYSGTPGPGNPPIVSASEGGTDPYGNPVQSGVVSQSGGQTSALSGAELVFSSGGFISGSSGLVLGGNIGLNAIEVLLPFSNALIAVQPGTSFTEETWHPMTLVNGWANAAGFVTAQYRKVASPPNSVEVIGVLNAAAASAAMFCTLPAGYIPASKQPAGGAGESGGVPAGLSPWILCDTSGNLNVENTGAVPAAFLVPFHGFISLDA